MLANVMRWVRVRGLVEGPMQTGRAEAVDDDVRDDARRPQDYGFAAMPVDGQGLKLEIGGHTIIVRMDRIGERPQLDAYDVAVWHKEGHMVKLKAGRVVELTGNRLVANMSESIELNSPTLTHNGTDVGSDHAHGGVTRGGDVSAGPQGPG